MGKVPMPLMRRGFSFTEIMFAVIILGIGFIMIASIFPVAIQQGKLTGEETTGAAVAREALSYLSQAGDNSDSLTTNPLFGATSAPPQVGVDSGNNSRTIYTPGKVNSIAPPGVPANWYNLALWNAVKTSFILPSDSRFAYVGLYRRDGDPANKATWSPYAQVWIIPTTVRTRTLYDPATDAGVSGFHNLQPRSVQVSIYYPPGTPSLAGTGGYVLLDWNPTGSTTSLVEGCYVMIRDDHIAAPGDATLTPPVIRNVGRMNGRVYHVGGRRPDLDCLNVAGTANGVAYDLAPDGDFVPDFGANGRFDPQPVGSNTPDPTSDDIVTIGMLPGGTAPNSPVGKDPFGNASQPADAWILGTDPSVFGQPGKAQDISAFTTFVKVN